MSLDRPPGLSMNAPHPLGRRDEGLKRFGQNRDELSISFQHYRCKPLFLGSKPSGSMQRIGRKIPGILAKLMILALSSEDLRPDVRRHLEEVLSCR